MTSEKKYPEYQIVDGIRLPYAFDPRAYRDTVNYKPRDDDVFVVTYPKCGTTWMQYLTYLIFNDAKETEDLLELNRHFPFMEMQGIDAVENMIRPGVLKTHVNLDPMQYSSKAKYIYVARNPKDCCVSFYHHTEQHPGFNFAGGEFEVFFELFFKGEVDYGDYFDHFLPWYERRNDPNVHFILFEDLKHKPKESVYKLASFLGDEYKSKIDKDPSHLDKILQMSSIESMKKTVKPLSLLFQQPGFDTTVLPSGLQHAVKKMQALAANQSGHVRTETFTLIRKGVTGGWREMFTEDQNRRMDERIEEKLGGTEILRFWKDGSYM